MMSHNGCTNLGEILVKEILLYTGKFPLGASLVNLDIEINLICSLSVNPQVTPHKQK